MCARRRRELDRWALFVAVLALGFTAYSFFRQQGLQQRLAAIEEDRRREEVASRLQADVGAGSRATPRATPRPVVVLGTISSSSATRDQPERRA
jgi:hypothetical protein